MPVKIFIITLLLSIQGAVMPMMAQSKNEDRVTLRKISLKGPLVFKPEDLPHHFSGITVVNALWDSTRLGFVEVGLYNKKVLAVPEKNMSAYLLDYIDTALATVYEPGKPAMLWVVEDVRIGEHTGDAGEKAYVRLKATAYLSDGEIYKELISRDIVHYNTGLDVTHKHGNNLAKAIQELYLAADSALLILPVDAPILSYNELMLRYLQKREVPALKDSVLNEGVYYTFESFLRNKPDRALTKEESKSRRKVPLIPTDLPMTEKADVWGVVKKGIAYKSVKKGDVLKRDAVVALTKRGYGYVLSNYQADYRQQKNERMMNAIGAGTITAFMMNGVVRELAYVDNFPILESAKAEATAIDMETGNLIF
ncbi:hypothetical protein ACDQ55_03670 [Chitinophaga sp. 30R24]|uniref:hypothetical protein n=1 Tax=Chitinophaga sp. 30R24 TaxID=3248838 RepID=UPI003B903CB4